VNVDGWEPQPNRRGWRPLGLPLLFDARCCAVPSWGPSARKRKRLGMVAAGLPGRDPSSRRPPKRRSPLREGSKPNRGMCSPMRRCRGVTPFAATANTRQTGRVAGLRPPLKRWLVSPPAAASDTAAWRAGGESACRALRPPQDTTKPFPKRGFLGRDSKSAAGVGPRQLVARCRRSRRALSRRGPPSTAGQTNTRAAVLIADRESGRRVS
jgi:hypothetical protein